MFAKDAKSQVCFDMAQNEPLFLQYSLKSKISRSLLRSRFFGEILIFFHLLK